MKTSAAVRVEGRTYRAREFAELAGVTVRALHYYDRLGLLSPRRTAARHRVYSSRDLEQVKQIVALKAIGLPLKDIAVLRDASGLTLASVLRGQRASLEHQQRLLSRLISAIHDVEDALGRGTAPHSDLLRRIVEVIQVQNSDHSGAADDEWRMVVKETSRHRRALAPGVLVELGKQWEILLADIQSALDEDPAAPIVQQLAARWVALIQAMNGTAVPLGTLLKCGKATLDDFAKRSPEIVSSGWGRGMNLMVRAVEAHGHTPLVE